MKYLKFILITIISFSLFIKTKATQSTDYDISINKNDTLISFIMEDNLNALYIKNKNVKTLIILSYNNIKNIEKSLKIYNIDSIDELYNISPVILSLYNKTSKMLKVHNNYIKLDYNNFCIYNFEYQEETEKKDCRFIYILNHNPNITQNNYTNQEVVYQNYNSTLPTIIQEDIYNKWIDLYTINMNEYTILKISNNDYETIVIPRNNNNF